MRVLLFFVLVFISACDDPNPPVVEVITLQHDKPTIAGGNFAVHSRAFGNGRSPAIAGDTSALQYTRVNDTTLLVHVPGTMRGEVTVTVDGNSIGQINVAGFVSFRPRTVTITGNPRQFPKQGPVSLIAGDGNEGVVQFIPATGEIRPLLQGYWLDDVSTRSIAPTPHPSVFLLQRVGRDPVTGGWIIGPLEAWDLSGVPQRITEYPDFNNLRVAAQLNDSMFLRGMHHTISLFKLVDETAAQTFSGTYEEINDVVLSPAGDRAAVKVHLSPMGPPVFDMNRGDTAYHIRSIQGAEGVAFSQTGDTLFMLGYNQHGGQSHFMVLNAQTGAELARLTLDDWAENFAVDVERSFAYMPTAAYGAGTASALRVLVLDYLTMEVVGNMVTPATSGVDCFYPSMSVGADGVFFVCGGDTWQFDRVSR